MSNRHHRSCGIGTLKATALAAALLGMTGAAHAYKFETGGDWDVNLDTSVQYTGGWRAQKLNNYIGNHPFFAEGDYKFANQGDMVTNRAQALVELQGVYQGWTGFRLSGSAWKDFAYSDTVKTNPNPAFSTFLSYPSGQYTGATKKYHIQGGELLDAFVFANGKVGDTPVYGKFGRLTQFWGNAFFFGFSNIAYSQSPIDFIKGFSQPGSEVKELFLPRTQALVTAQLTPELSVTGQYFLEFEPNRYPEGGTYLGSFDILYRGPQSGGALAGAFGGPVTAGRDDQPKNLNNNFGVKVAWSPEWAKGDLGFYYRQFDEVHPWALADIGAAGGGAVHLSYAQKVKLLGMSYERTFGPISTGYEVSYRQNTALNSAFTNGIPGVPTTQGATGNLFNVVANALVQLGTTPLWDTGTLIAELSYTNLLKVTGHPELFNGVGHAACTTNNKWDGCATKQALALAVLFEPQWLQVFPGWDMSAPLSYTIGLKGNPAYAAGGFYAQGTNIYSAGVKFTYKSNTTITLAYNGYYWHHGPTTNVPGLGTSYAGFGGNGPVSLNDRGWVSLTLKSSF
ncbi:hypothetical protein PTE30175_04919 [Pandoraea terrae]|uniref:DUF1302 domain-containing protein n=1 Tax=Pandoraea terrae TaxID=1537710 RepID=A0A5E4Z5G4_9BURK|nr:DUF1302 family protein [Pandoraea terrae]VVE55590.1 hypothetical protein PTE30175_04919 [Pandoraea terrae]